jgi:hypothetical protein
MRTACRTGGGRRWEAECSRWAGGNLAVMCAACPQNRAATVSPWTSHCMLLHAMIEAGCQFGPDDLTMHEWFGLSDLKAALAQDADEAIKAKRRPGDDGPINITMPQR